MNNNLNLSPDQVDSLLRMAGEKLGTDPNQLRQQLESGSLGNILGKMDPGSAAQVNKVLQDPQALQQMLSSQKVQVMLKALLGGKG